MSSNQLITLDGGQPFVRLKLFDGAFSPIEIPETLGRTSTHLTPGLYVAQFETSVWRHQRAFAVLPDIEYREHVGPPQSAVPIVDAAAPIRGGNTFDLWDADVAADRSRRMAELIPGAQPEGSLLLMVRKRPLSEDAMHCAVSAFAESPWAGITLSTDARQRVPINRLGWTETTKGLACVHVALPVGGYLLQRNTGHGQPWSQFVDVARGMQTQVFVTDEGRRNAPLAAAKLAIHIVDGNVGFDPTGRGTLETEELLNLLGGGAPLKMTAAVQQAFAVADAPMLDLALMAAAVDLNGEWPQFPIDRTLRLNDRLPAVPDVRLLSVTPNDLARERMQLSDVPMLAAMWDLALLAENDARAIVAGGSIAAMAGPVLLGSGPWLRFRWPEARDFPSRTGDAGHVSAPKSGAELETFRSEIEPLAESRNIAARVQYHSSYLNALERRLVSLTCPAIDTTLSRIMVQYREREAEPGHASGGAVEWTPLEEPALVRSLRLPRASISLVAASVRDKLTRHSILPTDRHLETFVRNETLRQPEVEMALDSLDSVSAGIFHVVQDRNLSMLSLLYLYYVGSPALSDRPSINGLVELLAGLGFVHAHDREALNIDHIFEAQRATAEYLKSFYAIATNPELGLSNDVLISLASREDYRPGELCRVERRDLIERFSSEAAKAWVAYQEAYTPGLAPQPAHSEQRFDASVRTQLLSTQITVTSRVDYWIAAMTNPLADQAAAWGNR